MASIAGESLDAPGWSVTAAYVDRDGQWKEDDGELTIDLIEGEFVSATDRAFKAAEERVDQVKVKVAAPRGQ